MSKKDKKKQNNNNSNQNNKQVEKPTIVVKPSNEIQTTEEGEQLLNESLAKVEEYCDNKQQEADKYYENKKQEADKLKENAEQDIQKQVDKAVQAKYKEMKEEIEDAKKEAKSIVSTAEKEAKEKVTSLEKREQELDTKYEEYTKQVAELESNKISYKQEVLEKIKEEMSTIAAEKEKLEKEIDSIKLDVRKKDIDIAALEEDIAFYEEQMSSNSVRKAEIVSYKTQLEDLQVSYGKLEQLYKEQQEKLNSLTSQILLYGDDPQKALKDNAELLKKNTELQNLIASCPSKEELASLRETNKKFEELNNKLELVSAEKLRLESENIDLKVSKDEIESYRRFIKILELQKYELQKELERNIELYSTSTEKVFASLSLIDKTTCNDYPSFKITLKQLCDRFRSYLANRPSNPLYYEEKTIRTFIAGFASSRLMILEGLSGTGKSSLPRAFADFMGSKTIEVPVQSSWKDRNDLLGFYNDFKKQYKETEFLKALYSATHDPNNIYVIVLDEMNLSRIEYYFADLLSVLEKPNIDDWKIELISDYASITQQVDAWPKKIIEGKLQICDNTWFVGTANKDDSTFIITDKVYDRSVVLNFDKKGEKEKIDNSLPIQMNNNDFQSLLRSASRFKNAADEKKYLDMIGNLDNFVKDMFQITFGNRISNQLEKFVPVYLECGGTIDEAVDIMFSRKILRKLEGIYDEDTKTKLDMLKDEIESKNYKMPITIAAILRMIEKI